MSPGHTDAWLEERVINPIDARANADQILLLERGALDRWGNGDPDGFLELYAADITYFDPVTAARIDGHQAMVNYYRPFVGKIHIARYEMLNPHVVVDGNMALLTYNLVNYIRDAQGVESVGSRWNSTAVYQRGGATWKAIHSHWSFTRHTAFQNMTPEASEGLV
jgi:ketosteroid isomerase-like protein